MIEQEWAEGRRFRFGDNWSQFLSVVDNDRVRVAEDSLKDMLEIDSLLGRSFLDIGSGSGLFSLAAKRLGANVVSFDYDPSSAACAIKFRGRFYPDDETWRIAQGSVLDREFIKGLGEFDIVYSWGVLHHTGAMWQAMENAASCVKIGGKLFIAIYNDQGIKSTLWRWVKRLYCAGRLGRWAVMSLFVPVFVIGWLVRDLTSIRFPWLRYTDYKSRRGMSVFHDLRDWLGGYPFEVASSEAVTGFFEKRQFSLDKLTSVGGRSGCNEFVFIRNG